MLCDHGVAGSKAPADVDALRPVVACPIPCLIRPLEPSGASTSGRRVGDSDAGADSKALGIHRSDEDGRSFASMHADCFVGCGRRSYVRPIASHQMYRVLGRSAAPVRRACLNPCRLRWQHATIGGQPECGNREACKGGLVQRSGRAMRRPVRMPVPVNTATSIECYIIKLARRLGEADVAAKAVECGYRRVRYDPRWPAVLLGAADRDIKIDESNVPPALVPVGLFPTANFLSGSKLHFARGDPRGQACATEHSVSECLWCPLPRPHRSAGANAGQRRPRRSPDRS